MGDRRTIELRENGATLFPYTPLEDYEYPLESWPKDLKRSLIAEHKNDPAADIGTGDRQPQRLQEIFNQTEEVPIRICGTLSNA